MPWGWRGTVDGLIWGTVMRSGKGRQMEDLSSQPAWQMVRDHVLQLSGSKASLADTVYHNKSHSAGSICMPHDTSPAGCSSHDQLSETQVLRSWGLRQDFLLDPHHGNCCTELAPDGLQLLLQSLILHMPHVSM